MAVPFFLIEEPSPPFYNYLQLTSLTNQKYCNCSAFWGKIFYLASTINYKVMCFFPLVHASFEELKIQD